MLRDHIARWPKILAAPSARAGSGQVWAIQRAPTDTVLVFILTAWTETGKWPRGHSQCLRRDQGWLQGAIRDGFPEVVMLEQHLRLPSASQQSHTQLQEDSLEGGHSPGSRVARKSSALRPRIPETPPRTQRVHVLTVSRACWQHPAPSGSSRQLCAEQASGEKTGVAPPEADPLAVLPLALRMQQGL